MVLDAHGKIGWGRSDIGGDPIVVVLTESVTDAHLAGLRGEGVSDIFAGKSEIDLALTLEILNRELGVKRLLLEGGGAANGAFLRAGLVDELNLILCPSRGRARGAPIVFDLDGGRERPARARHRNDAGEHDAARRRRAAAAALLHHRTIRGGRQVKALACRGRDKPYRASSARVRPG